LDKSKVKELIEVYSPPLTLVQVEVLADQISKLSEEEIKQIKAAIKAPFKS